MLNLRSIFLVLVALFSISNIAFSQNVGNEWIIPSQEYFRFSITQTGMYRIAKDELLNAGVPIANYAPQQLQLFSKGNEIPCYIEGESSGDIQYIEFYAEKNDGWFDVGMYNDETNQANPNYSFINDTASVFITWGSSYTNKRYKLVNDQDYSGLTPLNYCFREVLQQYTGQYYIGPVDCEYTEAEAWADSKFGLNSERTSAASKTKTIETPHLFKGTVLAEFDWSLITVSSGSHHINTKGPGFESDTMLAGYGNVKGIKQVVSSELTESNEIVFTVIDDMGSETDYFAAAYIKATYPALYNFDGEDHSLFVLNNSGASAYIEITGFNHGDGPVLYDIGSQTKIMTTVDNDIVKAKIPPSELTNSMVLTSPSAYKRVSEIRACNFTDFSKMNKSFIILTHSSLQSAVEEYSQYRDAYVVDVDELYNQFGYGIQKHPLAIRNFTTYALNNALVKPEYLFIIGKGVSSTGDDKYAGYRINTDAYKNCLIPPMGNPSSDILLTAKTDGVSPVSALFMGRLSALTAQQVTDYLNKVKEFESNEPAEWMKRAIHFGGGSYTAEQNSFASYLKGFEDSFEDTLFGGEVVTLLKASSDPIEITQSDSVENMINGGVSIMTFFGHGSAGGFDQNIDEPSAFTNFGKYPLLIANSCYTGNIFFPGQYSTSEDWVIIPNKGTIGFLAMSHQGIGYYLNAFTSTFYANLSSYQYGQSLGQILNTTRNQVIENNSTLNMRNTIQEFTLHGDPAIVLNSFELPDLIMENSSVTFSPSVLTTQVDSFNLNVVAKNISRAVSDTFDIQITRTFQDGTIVDTSIFLSGLNYKQDIIIKYPIDRVKGVGLNNFHISIDALGLITELSESNNSINLDTYIFSADLVATIPYNYSLIPEAPSALKAVTGNPFASESISTFQVDTSSNFDSPFLYSAQVNHGGGVVEWVPQVSFAENQVFYWRAGKEDSKNNEQWSTSSFCFQSGKKGWMQGDFGQFIDSEFTFMKASTDLEQFEFITTPKRLSCHNVGSPNTSSWGDVNFAIDEDGDNNCCGVGAAMLLVVIDTLDLTTWESDRDEFGHRNYPQCSSRTRNDLYFVFNGDNTGLGNLANVVNNYVPDGFYILIYSFNRIQYQALSETNIRHFEDWGAANFRFQPDYTPYIFYTQKGNPSVSIEVLGTSETDIIDLNVDLKTNFIYGNIESTLIGPSQNWEIVEWTAEKVEDNPDEEYYLRINGITPNGNKVLLTDSITDTQIDISNLSTEDYPYLKLGFFTRDEQFKTPTQLRSWSVLYTPLTDLAINPQKGFEFYADTLQEGDVGSMSIAIENIGSEDADSILVTYWLQNSKNEVFPLSNHRLKPLLSGQSFIDTVSFQTMNHSGLMSLWISINPVVQSTGVYDQPEQNYFNNIGNKVFYIEQDETNPLLDVTFDGVHIMDGDIVSARPAITVQLKDENEFIALDDTSTFSLYLKSQQTGIETKIALGSNNEVTFIPAELPKNKAQIIYQPEFEIDGIYELRVRGKDATGNESGMFDYQISFQVINESTITNVFNYPNPFSTSTRFVFELTGSEVPEEIRIDILTVTGKVIKIIYQDDLGPVTVGKNITAYAWDGRDMYGDPLANGVYFYKVSARLNGEELKHRDTGTSKFFKNGFGKMYIMR